MIDQLPELAMLFCFPLLETQMNFLFKWTPPTLRTLLAIVLTLMTVIPLYACLWDHDTLKMEQSRFPDTLELITGKFKRHSQEFYKWRIKDRKTKLISKPDHLEYIDDLAVAYDKTGEHQKAIDIMLDKEKLKPGMYETEANLGTFYIHAGQLEKGLEHIKRAIKINPDAHFGREVYQQYLVEYVLSIQKDGKTILPLQSNSAERRVLDFDMYMLKVSGIDNRYDEEDGNTQYAKAIKGIQGMMRFGNYDSPVLLEVLGDLLMKGKGFGNIKDAKQLAARAYLKASYEVKDEAEKKAYRKLAGSALSLQKGVQLKELEKNFKVELAEAGSWFSGVQEDEIAWINSNEDVDARFSAKYYSDPELFSSGFIIRDILLNRAVLVVILFIILVSVYVCIRWVTRRGQSVIENVPSKDTIS